MPTFEFTSPEGKSYSVAGPEGATSADAFKILQGHLGLASTPEPSTGLGEDLAGVAKAAPGRALASVAGLPGDLLHLGMRALGDNLTPESAFGSNAINKALGSTYEAKTEPGRIAQKVGDFAPALIGGPEGLAAKALTRVAAPVAASEAGRAVAGPYGEVAGALVGAGGATAAARRFEEAAAARRAIPSAEEIIRNAKGQFRAAEDMNLTVGSDFATSAAAKMRNDLRGFDPEAQSAAFKAADRLEGLGRNPLAPTANEPIWYQGVWHGAGEKPVSDYWTTDLAKAKEYSGPNGFVFAAKQSAFPEPVAKQGNVLSNKKFNPGEPYSIPDVETIGRLPRSANEQDFLGLLPAAAKPVAMNDVELIRKQLTSLKTSPDASVREAARRAISSLQESQIAITPEQTLRGDAGVYAQLMKSAIANYAAGKRSNTVMGKVALGDLNAATAGSGANEDNALRQAIKQLVRPVNNDIVPKASRLGFNSDEIAAMNKVARGTTLGNTARYLGKLAPTGSVSGVLSGGAGFAAAGPAGAIGLPAAGYLAKKIGDLSTKRAVQALDSLVRSRSPLAQQVAAQLPPAVVAKLPTLTKLLLGSAAIQPLTTQYPAQQRSY